MARQEPLRQADLALLGGYGFFLFVLFVWLCAVGVSLQWRPEDLPILTWVIRKAPPILAFVQGLFFLAATQFRPFRQRFMNSDAKPKDAFVGMLVLWAAAGLFTPLLID